MYFIWTFLSWIILGSPRIGVITDFKIQPKMMSSQSFRIIRDYSWFRIWQQIKKILNNNYDKSSINYFYFNQSDYTINKNHRHFAFPLFLIFASSSDENRSSLLGKGFQPIRVLHPRANEKVRKKWFGNPTWESFQ